MKTTILFGGESREQLVAVASAQNLLAALPEADLWFWAPNGDVVEARREAVSAHQRPFEILFQADGRRIGTVTEAVRAARHDHRVLVLSLHGGSAEDGRFQAICEAEGVAYTGSDAAASRFAFDKIRTKAAVSAKGLRAPGTVALADLDAALMTHGALVGKPVEDGSSFGLMFIRSAADVAALRAAADRTPYLVEPMIVGGEATCGVLHRNGQVIALPPVEIIPAEGAFDYQAKYLAAATQEICPGRFAPEMTEAIQQAALTAHRTVGASGYSRSDFVVTPDGPVFLEINTLPGLTPASLFPKELKAAGISFKEFVDDQIRLARQRVGDNS